MNKGKKDGMIQGLRDKNPRYMVVEQGWEGDYGGKGIFGDADVELHLIKSQNYWRWLT